MPTSMTQNNTEYYLHYDQVGSLRAVTDTTGNIIKEITYDTYGNILSDTNANFKVPFGFAGGLYDTDTKLTRFGYRDYDAYTGKWTAKVKSVKQMTTACRLQLWNRNGRNEVKPCRIDFSGGDTNLYGYVLGDPVSGIDKNGLWCISLGVETQNVRENPVGPPEWKRWGDPVQFGDTNVVICYWNKYQRMERIQEVRTRKLCFTCDDPDPCYGRTSSCDITLEYGNWEKQLDYYDKKIDWTQITGSVGLGGRVDCLKPNR